MTAESTEPKLPGHTPDITRVIVEISTWGHPYFRKPLPGDGISWRGELCGTIVEVLEDADG